MATKFNLREGETLLETSDGFVSTRVGDVTGLAGRESAYLFKAARRRGVPKVGDQHPDIPGIVCTRRGMKTVGADGVRITFTYSKLTTDMVGGPVEVEFVGDTLNEETVFDIDGNLIQTKYTSFTAGTSSLTTRTHRMAIERPTFTVRLSSTRRNVPKILAADLTGAINAREWSGFPPLTWLIRSVSSSQQAVDRHRVTVTATYRKTTWLGEVATDVDGIIPEDATVTNGIRTVRVYQEVDFSRLGMSF